MVINNILIKKVRVPVYSTWLWVVTSDSIRKSIDQIEDMIDCRVVKKKNKSSTRACMFAYELETGCYRALLFLTHTAEPGEVGHECNHIKNVLFKWHGVHLSVSNDEHESYFLEWLIDQAHSAINKYKKLKIYTRKAVA